MPTTQHPSDKPANFADYLYREVLPAVYRTEDTSGDMRDFVAACAEMLDAVHGTLQQRLADNFPDVPVGTGGREPQEWLLPYFAELLDARLVSPLVEGRRREISRAIPWRQAKGTLSVIEQVSEDVGQTETVVQEGWQRVAVTPRLNRPLQPASAYAMVTPPNMANPGSAARHPDLPAAMIDLRQHSGAVLADTDHPRQQNIQIDGVRYRWRQASPHGAPCYPDSFDDVSRRTPDLRTPLAKAATHAAAPPSPNAGHYHHRRVLAFLPPPAGFFGAPQTSVAAPTESVGAAWDPDTVDADFTTHITVEDSESITVFRNATIGTDDERVVRISGDLEVGGRNLSHVYRFEDLVLDNTLAIRSSNVELNRCAVRSVDYQVGSGVPEEAGWLHVQDSLLETLTMNAGAAQLVYTTVLDTVDLAMLNASDCLFTGDLVSGSDPLADACIRFSRIPATTASLADSEPALSLFSTTSSQPVFFANTFGEHGCGVLHPASSDDVLMGAEDDGEPGAFHHRYHVRTCAAVLNKLTDFLPVGLQAVVVFDAQLLDARLLVEED